MADLTMKNLDDVMVGIEIKRDFSIKPKGSQDDKTQESTKINGVMIFEGVLLKDALAPAAKQMATEWSTSARNHWSTMVPENGGTVKIVCGASYGVDPIKAIIAQEGGIDAALKMFLKLKEQGGKQLSEAEIEVLGIV